MCVHTRVDFIRNTSLFRENDHIKTIKIKNKLNLFKNKTNIVWNRLPLFLPGNINIKLTIENIS